MAKQSAKSPSSPNKRASDKANRSKGQSSGIEMPFGRENFILMGIGFAIIIIGYILMSGDTNIYSFRKITLAPIIVMFGYAFEVYAILKTPAKAKAEQQAEEDQSG
jgi:hypothetical protein